MCWASEARQGPLSMGVGFSESDRHLRHWGKDVMGKSKMGFVMQMVKKVYSVENGFGMGVTKKGFEVGSKSVLHFKGVSDLSILCKL